MISYRELITLNLRDGKNHVIGVLYGPPRDARVNCRTHEGKVAAIYPAFVWSISTPGPDGNTRVSVLIRSAVSKNPDPGRFAETQG